MPMYTFIYNLLNVLVQIANKMGFKIKKSLIGANILRLYNSLTKLELQTKSLIRLQVHFLRLLFGILQIEGDLVYFISLTSLN
jgi:hypothetical protein